MESGLPMLNCLLQHTLRSLCSCSSDSSSSSNSSSKWVYAVFWRILPRNYPPPKWDYGGSVLDRSKGNTKNWILVWEDGFCDFYECEQAGSGYIKGRFGADVFFKMSHEVYNYGEGLLGKVAVDNSHRWVFRDAPYQGDNPNFISSWNISSETQPKAWDCQFNSGIQTIAVISVREGLIQLGSFDKIVEDLNLVISIQRKLSYLQSIPGVFAMQRPYLPIQHPYILRASNTQNMILNGSSTSAGVGVKRLFNQTPPPDEVHHSQMIKSMNLGWNTPHKGTVPGSSSTMSVPDPNWSITFPPPLLPSISSSLGALLSKLPSVSPSPYVNDAIHEAPDTTTTTNTAMLMNNSSSHNNNNCEENQGKVSNGISIKIESSPSCHLDIARQDHHCSNNIPGLENGDT